LEISKGHNHVAELAHAIAFYGEVFREAIELSTSQLIHTAQALLADQKDILAMNESNPTCNKRFAKLGIPQSEEARRAYRELIITMSGLGESISGEILYDETIHQQKKDDTAFLNVLSDAGILPGIKEDTGAKEISVHPGEKLTEGLDGLRDRLKEYFQMGARFAKWRAVIAIGDGLPSRSGLEGLLRTVPAALPGIAFLSGGQSAELASTRLNVVNVRFKPRAPWALAFSFARAIQQPALEIGLGHDANLKTAQEALLRWARCNPAARRGERSAAMERT